jgi:hypothetical protein
LSTDDAGGIARLQLDPTKPNHITIVGRKGSGKSVLARRFWAGWPGDRLVIDPTGDVDAGEDAERLELPLPSRWPNNPLGDLEAVGGKPKRSTLRYVPDMGASTYVDDMDRAVGLAFTKGHALLWVDEVGELTNASSTPPHVRRLLHQSRHRKLSMLFCGPRPMDINPLVMSQADYIAVFRLPNPADRKRIADVTGLDLGELEDALAEAVSVDHGYVWYDVVAEELLICPPLPHRGPPPPSKDRFADDDGKNVTASM